MPEPLIVAGTGSRSLESTALVLAALQHAAGGRTDVLLRVGDCPSGGDVLMRHAAVWLRWPRPQVFRKDPEDYPKVAPLHRNTRLAAAKPPAAVGVALFTPGLRNRGTVDCGAKLVNAGVLVTCWCEGCGPVPMGEPCPEHMIDEVLATWRRRTGVLL
jgi:hypothetical protein